MESVLAEIKKQVLAYNRDGVRELAEKALAQGVEPLALVETLREVIAGVGEQFASHRVFLPELVGAAGAMEAGMAVAQAAIARRGLQAASFATVAIGTVAGDIHSIGKNLVAALLSAAGATVLDLGINVPVEMFLAEAQEYQPQVLAMSALLTTTAPEQRKVIERLAAAGLRESVKVIVGGGAISAAFAESIGADGYGGTAPQAVELVRRLVGHAAGRTDGR